MQVVISDPELQLDLSDSSNLSSPSSTPSFQPNTPTPSLEPGLSIPLLISRLNGSMDDPSAGLADLDLPDNLDWNDPLSKLLKIGTSSIHVQAEHSPGASALVKGHLGLHEYIRWLAVLWRVYNAIELSLDEHSTDSVLASIYNPSLLARAPALAKDIDFLISLLPFDTGYSQPYKRLPDGPLPPFPLPAFLAPLFVHTPPTLQTYINHVRKLASSADTAQRLLAHAYVRYVGDLSGGQIMARSIRRAYRLQGMDGLRFYHFDMQDKVDEDWAEESRAEKKKRAGEVKTWYRQGMDSGVGDDKDLKATLVREANLAFALNIQLFSIIRVPTASTSTDLTLTSSTSPALISDETGQPLRYFERREMEKKRRELANPPPPPNTWRQRIEKFLLSAVTVLFGALFSHYGLPYIQAFIRRQGWLDGQGWLLGGGRPEL